MNTHSFESREDRPGEPGGRRRHHAGPPHRGPFGHGGPGGPGGAGPWDGDGDEDGPRGPRGRGPRGEGRGPRGDGPRGSGPRGSGPRGRGPRDEGDDEGGPRGGRGRRGFGRPGGWQNVDVPSADDAQAWFEGRLPEGWFSEVSVDVDREEIIVSGTLADADEKAEQAAAEGRISRFRADTRDERVTIAEEAQSRYGRKVSWGARAGEVETLFTHISVPVMTRLQQPERRVLDTLVDSGVARSRSEALSWAVRLVGEHSENWLSELRTAMSEVDKLRSQGPNL